MKIPPLFLLLVTVLAHSSSCFPADRSRPSKHASWDDVNVVAHGLLQLGQGLKEHVDKTKAQMREVDARFRDFNGTLEELKRRQRERDDAAAARGGEERQLAEGAMLKVEEVKREAQDMSSRMDRLEEVLAEPSVDGNHSEHAGSPFIQKLLASQNRRIDQLVEKIKQQQDKLEKQSLHLQALQSKVSHKRVKSHRRRDGEATLRGGATQTHTETGLARDCHELFVRGQRVSGVYAVQPENAEPFNVLCDMSSDVGWTVVQRRRDGAQSFNQLWERYRRGFGTLDGDFWLGLDNLRSLSAQSRLVLQVELSDAAGRRRDARYQFRLDGEEEKFAIHLQTASRSILSGVPFSTADRDNDLDAETNCAERLSGGWWFSGCGDSNLNGRFPSGRRSRRTDMFWRTTEGRSLPLTTTLLKIAPAFTEQ